MTAKICEEEGEEGRVRGGENGRAWGGGIRTSAHLLKDQRAKAFVDGQYDHI